jgi:Leucine-rich repeat (LRR) protein
VFEEFANWCTARKGNGMFTSYTNNKKPDGKKSDIYIIIDNNFFTGKSKDIYQIHFESGQIKDRQNGQNVDIFKQVLTESEGIANFFYEELLGMAKIDRNNIENNRYLKYLIQFGFSESVFELIDESTSSIRFMTSNIKKIPNISRFKMLDQLIITNAGLTHVDSSIGSVGDLVMLVLAGNALTEIPREIGNLKKLKFMNLVGNPLRTIPDEIKYLDKTNGGSLLRLCVKEEDIGAEKIKKLKELLPSATIG